MRVVKPGRNSPEWKREFDCGSCGAVVEVERSDLYTKTAHEFSGGRATRVKFTCCSCGNEHTVDIDRGQWKNIPTYEEWRGLQGIV